MCLSPTKKDWHVVNVESLGFLINKPLVERWSKFMFLMFWGILHSAFDPVLGRPDTGDYELATDQEC